MKRIRDGHIARTLASAARVRCANPTRGRHAVAIFGRRRVKRARTPARRSSSVSSRAPFAAPRRACSSRDARAVIREVATSADVEREADGEQSCPATSKVVDRPSSPDPGARGVASKPIAKRGAEPRAICARVIGDSRRGRGHERAPRAQNDSASPAAPPPRRRRRRRRPPPPPPPPRESRPLPRAARCSARAHRRRALDRSARAPSAALFDPRPQRVRVERSLAARAAFADTLSRRAPPQPLDLRRGAEQARTHRPPKRERRRPAIRRCRRFIRTPFVGRRRRRSTAPAAASKARRRPCRIRPRCAC